MKTVPCDACGKPLHERHAIVSLKAPKAAKWTEATYRVCSTCITPLVQRMFQRANERSTGQA